MTEIPAQMMLVNLQMVARSQPTLTPVMTEMPAQKMTRAPTVHAQGRRWFAMTETVALLTPVLQRKAA